MKEIVLTQEKVALVDDEDYERVSQHKWFAEKHRQTFYARTKMRIDGTLKNVYMHRFILEPTTNTSVDHQNHNGLDNRRSNLRTVTTRQNSFNLSKQKRPTSSRYKGVCWVKTRNVWMASIRINGKNRFLGHFATEEEAARAYDQAALEYHGEYGYPNFPPHKKSPTGVGLPYQINHVATS